VPYVTGGLDDDWTRVVEAVAAAGADAVEIGIPFSDPVMDGPVIQQASQRALARGATPTSILAEAAKIDAGVPLVVMTYYNIVFRAGHLRFARSLAEQGIAGAIVPDLPLVELDGWSDAAGAAGVETVLLAAPNTPDVTLAEICRRSRGWVYGIALMGVTGERSLLGATAGLMGRRLKAVTDKPRGGRVHPGPGRRSRGRRRRRHRRLRPGETAAGRRRPGRRGVVRGRAACGPGPKIGCQVECVFGRMETWRSGPKGTKEPRHSRPK